MNFFKKKKIRSTPNDIAQALLDEFVNQTDDEPEYLPAWYTDEKLVEAYQAKAQLYRLALVLYVLQSEEQNNHKFVAVRDAFEGLIFTMSEEEAAPLIKQIDFAIKDLCEIFPPDEARPNAWATNWFEEIGINEGNPFTLLLLIVKWTGLCTSLVDTIREFDPI